MIRHLYELTGGFGKVLLTAGTDWTSQEALNRGLELFAREVFPAFQGSSEAPLRAAARAEATRVERLAEQRASISKAASDYVPPSQ